MKKHKNLLTYFILSSFFAVKITLTAPYCFASNTTTLYTNDTQYSPVVDAISLEKFVDFALVKSPVAAQKIIARQDLRQIKPDIIQSSKVALRELENAKRLSHESSIQNKIAQKAKDVYQDEYLLGKRNLNDLLTVEQDLIQAIQSQINADFDSLSAAIHYLSLSGELLNKLKS